MDKEQFISMTIMSIGAEYFAEIYRKDNKTEQIGLVSERVGAVSTILAAH